MTRARIVELVVGLAWFAMALEFDWAMLEGWDELPPTVTVIGGVGSIVIVLEMTMALIRRWMGGCPLPDQ